MEEQVVGQVLAVTPENHLINTACLCQNSVMNVELNTQCLRLSIVVSVEQNEFNTHNCIIFVNVYV